MSPEEIAEKIGLDLIDLDPPPLAGPSAPSIDYPIDALGDVLGPSARAIAAKVQCPLPMAAQSVLAVASLAAQALADVKLPYGQTRPLSLFMLTIAASGDRKSTADNEAMVPVRMRETQLGKEYGPQAERYDVRRTAWKAQRAYIERQKCGVDKREADLAALGPEPEAPILPILTVSETTQEGLAKHLPRLPGAVGVFSAEGGQFLAGYGFSAEKKLATAASFSTLWDGGGFRRLRAGEGLIDLRGRRLAAHLMIQPDAASAVMSDPILRDQGLLARFLVAAPETLAGTRFWREPEETIEPALKRYMARVLSIFEAPIKTTNGAGNELAPRVLELSDEARAAWIWFADDVEKAMAAVGCFGNLRDVAGKAAEQAARIAGVLAIVDDRAVQEIDGDTMLRACELARWYLDEALRITSAARVAPDVTAGDALLEWMRASGLREVGSRDVARLGPTKLRDKKTRDAAIVALVEAGDLIPVEGGRRKGWRIAK